MNKVNEEQEALDYLPLLPELVGDIHYALSSGISKSISCMYYRVVIEDADSAMSVVFLMDIADQNDTIAAISDAIIEGVDRSTIHGVTHVELLKPLRGNNYAVLGGFALE